MFKLMGVNTLTGNTWECVTDIETRYEAYSLQSGWTNLESDYKIEYYVVEMGA